jgi:hypothetical protein
MLVDQLLDVRLQILESRVAQVDDGGMFQHPVILFQGAISLM